MVTKSGVSWYTAAKPPDYLRHNHFFEEDY